jgi:hypothetical protein
VTSGFRREVDDNCVLLDCYAASSGKSLPTFRSSLSVLCSRVKEMQEEKLWGKRSQKFSKELPLCVIFQANASVKVQFPAQYKLIDFVSERQCVYCAVRAEYLSFIMRVCKIT